LNFSEDGFPEVRQLGRKKEFPVNDTQENYDNAGACHGCVTQSSGPQPIWLKYDRQASISLHYTHNMNSQSIVKFLKKNHSPRSYAINFFKKNTCIQ
jgi:hypothetical protein